MADEPLDEEPVDRRILRMWKVREPGPGFSSRVLDELDRRATRPVTRLRRRRAAAWIVGLSLAAGVAGVGFWSIRPLGKEDSAMNGTHSSPERASIDLGGLAVAVAEPSAELSWKVEGRDARIEQRSGDVFYRVDRGSKFTVTTPHGVVVVEGTCFRVEVGPMREWRNRVAAAAAGAAVTMTIVTVLEGKVLLRSDQGAVEAAAGDTAIAVDGEAPAKVDRADPTAPEPTGSASLAEMRSQEAAQRAKISELQAKVKLLERREKERARSDADSDGGPPKEKFVDLSPEELGVLADRCELRYDIPAYALEEAPREIDADKARDLGLKDKERSEVNRILREGDPELAKLMRAIYVEVTGDDAGAKTLSLRNLQHEVFAKSSPREMAEALEQLSRERAGRAKPPSSLDGRTPVERLLRALSKSGDRLEGDLGASLGKARAHELREKGIPFGRRTQAQCPDELP